MPRGALARGQARRADVNLVIFARHLRLRPFPVDTEEGRAAERYRRASWTMVAHAASSGANMLVLVLSVGWTVPYLGAERFGAWMTLASLAAMLGFLDLGLGNGLTNRIAQVASGRKAGELPRAVSGGLGVLAALSLVLMVVLSATAWLLPWQALIKTTSAELNSEVRVSALLFAGLFAASISFNGVLRIYHGLQRGFEVFATSAICTSIGLLCLYVATRHQAGMPVLLFCTMGATLAPGLWLWARLGRSGLFSFAGWAHSTRAERPKLLKISLLFLMLQIGTALGWGMDSVVVSSTLGASGAAAYVLTQRMFLIATQPMAILNAPLWPAYADADAKGDRAFIRTTLSSALTQTFAYAAVITFMLIAFREPVLRHWTSGTVVPTDSLVYALGAWAIVEAMAMCFAMFLNGTSIVKPQVVCAVVIVVVGVPLKFWLARTGGAAAMVCGFIALYALAMCIVFGVVYRGELRAKLELPR